MIHPNLATALHHCAATRPGVDSYLINGDSGVTIHDSPPVTGSFTQVRPDGVRFIFRPFAARGRILSTEVIASTKTN